MYFAKDKIETMEKEHKAKNEAWIKEMTEKINIAKNNIDEMKKVDSLDDLKKQLEILKSSISTFGDSNNAEISSLQVCLNSRIFILQFKKMERGTLRNPEKTKEPLGTL